MIGIRHNSTSVVGKSMLVPISTFKENNLGTIAH